jgi:hypothetical protein
MPSADQDLFARALLEGRHSIAALKAEFSETDEPAIDLTGRLDDLDDLQGSKVIPAPGVLAYLAGGDEITHAILDAAEEATEKHYQLPAGWFITSRRLEDPLRLDYMYLEKEV